LNFSSLSANLLGGSGHDTVLATYRPSGGFSLLGFVRGVSRGEWGGEGRGGEGRGGERRGEERIRDGWE